MKQVADTRKDQALMQQISLCKQDGPCKSDLHSLRVWLGSTTGNDHSLGGPGDEVWTLYDGEKRSKYEDDFMVLSSRHVEIDRFERWIGDTLLDIYHHCVAKRFVKVCRDIRLWE